MFETIIALDSSLTSTISATLPHNLFFDTFFSLLSVRGLTIIIWFALFCLFWYEERKDRTHHHFLISFMTSFGTTAVLVNIILKNIIERTRPWIEMGLTNTGCPADYSFPSGHASSAFAGAVVFAYFDKKRAWLYYTIAFLISLSRIYLSCHYLLDVVVGALIGYTIGVFSIKILRKVKIV